MLIPPISVTTSIIEGLREEASQFQQRHKMVIVPQQGAPYYTILDAAADLNDAEAIIEQLMNYLEKVTEERDVLRLKVPLLDEMQRPVVDELVFAKSQCIKYWNKYERLMKINLRLNNENARLNNENIKKTNQLEILRAFTAKRVNQKLISLDTSIGSTDDHVAPGNDVDEKNDSITPTRLIVFKTRHPAVLTPALTNPGEATTSSDDESENESSGEESSADESSEEGSPDNEGFDDAFRADDDDSGDDDDLDYGERAKRPSLSATSKKQSGGRKSRLELSKNSNGAGSSRSAPPNSSQAGNGILAAEKRGSNNSLGAVVFNNVGPFTSIKRKREINDAGTSTSIKRKRDEDDDEDDKLASVATAHADDTAQPPAKRGKSSAWSDVEKDCIDAIVRAHVNEATERYYDQKLWTRVSKELKKAGVDRSSTGCKNYWNRYGRARSGGVDERKTPNSHKLSTSTQTAKKTAKKTAARGN
jgi:hypothetical protein